MTVAYINNEGGVHSQALNQETMLLYKWAIPMGAQLQVVHQPWVDNILTDYLFRNVADLMQWSLDRKVVRCLFEMWGRPQIDVFVSASNTHLPLWYSRTYHPEAITPNALLQPWTALSLYSFPSFPLLPKKLAKIHADGVEEVIVIAPMWPRRTWYILLLHMAFKIPCLLSLSMDLLSQSLQAKGTLYHSDLKTLRLAAWKLSGRPSRVLAFHSPVPDQRHGGSMMADGKPLLAGVMNRVSIPFIQLYARFPREVQITSAEYSVGLCDSYFQ